MKGIVMRPLLFIFLLPIFIFPQPLSNRFSVEKLIAPGIASLQGSSNSNNVMVQSKMQNSILSTQHLSDLKHLKQNIKWSFYLKYGANLFSVIGNLKTYNYFTSENKEVSQDRLYDLSKITRSMHLINFFSYGLEFQALNSLRVAGQNLFTISENLPKEKSFELFEASRNLKKAGFYGMIGQSLGIIGSSMTYYALGQDVDSDNFGRGITIGGIFSLTSLIFKYISVNNIGHAGKTSQDFAKYLNTKWQKEYFAGFANNLSNYKNNWNTGFSIMMSGIAIMIGGSFLPDPTPARISLYMGGIFVFIGNIYMNWIAPYSLGNAADNLSGLTREISNK